MTIRKGQVNHFVENKEIEVLNELRLKFGNFETELGEKLFQESNGEALVKDLYEKLVKARQAAQKIRDTYKLVNWGDVRNFANGNDLTFDDIKKEIIEHLLGMNDEFKQAKHNYCSERKEVRDTYFQIRQALKKCSTGKQAKAFLEKIGMDVSSIKEEEVETSLVSYDFNKKYL